MLYEVNGEYHFTPDYDFFVERKVIKCRPASFYEKLIADDKIIAAIEKGKFSFLKQDEPTKFHTQNIISDSLGVHGLKNHADGKMYDSKSNLRKSYKQLGVIEVGNEPIPSKKPEIKGNFDCRKELAQAIQQHGLGNRK